jgi:hypothetical protein
MSDKNEVVFSLTIADFEDVLGRELTENELNTVFAKFSIDSWSEYVDAFFSARGFYE